MTSRAESVDMHFKIPWLRARDIPKVDLPAYRVKRLNYNYNLWLM